MISRNDTRIYHDLSSSCGKIDARKTHYRFNVDKDIDWTRIEESGLHFGPTLLQILGVDIGAMSSGAANAFQWAYAMAVCDAFFDFEEMVIRFVKQEQAHLEPTRSVKLLCEEELKHMKIFKRYRQFLTSQRPDLAMIWNTIDFQKHTIPGSPEDRDVYHDIASYHYVFWINTLFFEEFTIFLHQCLETDRGLIQPVWASIHNCHQQEEIQHLPTDIAYLRALSLSQEKRSLLSKSFLFRLEDEFGNIFGLKRALELVAATHPDTSGFRGTPFRDLPLFREILFSEKFRKFRDAAPYVSVLAHTARDSHLSVIDNNADMVGGSLPPFRDTHLSDILKRAADEHSDTIIVYTQDDGNEVSETYADLLRRAEQLSMNLTSYGLKHGSIVLLLLDKPHDFVGAFWACQLAGFVPVPAAVPLVKSNPQSDKRLTNLNRHLERPLILTDEVFCKAAPEEWRVISINQVAENDYLPVQEEAREIDVALLQFSSGSTSEPRGVVLTPQNVLANLTAISRHLKVTSKDCMVSWMPLHHDMGLCLHLASVHNGLRQVLMTPRNFARRPRLWLEKLEEYGATITASPNFGLSLCARKLTGTKQDDLDLSSVRYILNGAEPISPTCVEAFVATLHSTGLDPKAILPCYGLAEATTAVTLSIPGEELRSRTFARASLTDGSKAVEAPGTHRDAVRLVDVGVAIPGMEIRISNDDGSRAELGCVGEIEVRGPNVTAGYWKDIVGSAEMRRNRWVRTGDLGLVYEGRLFVAGRKKDVIFINGRKFLAQDLEETIRNIEGVSPDRIAVVGRTDPDTGAEQVLVFLRDSFDSNRSRSHVDHTVSASLANVLEYPVHRVLFLRSNRFPLTTSGKLQRYKLREAYDRGEFEKSNYRDTIAGDSAELSPGPYITIENSKREDYVIDMVRSIWADILNRPVEAIDINRNFFDIGGDSLRAIEIHSALEDHLGVLLDHRILIDCRTVCEQAEFLMALSQQPLKVRTDDANAVNSEVSDSTITGDSSRQSDESRNQDSNAVGRGGSDRDIAVIAMAGRFPGCDDLDEFWDLIRDSRSVYHEPPSDRWDVDAYYDPNSEIPGKTVCRAASFLDGIKEFDAAACGISDEEARQIDPQQRVFFEIVLDLIDRSSLSSNKVGVFAGAAENEYFSRHAAITERINRYSAQSNLANMLAARVSQLLRFTGPALTLDAACATSLVAVHYACQSLRAGECDLAVAGGIQINLSAVPQLMFSQARVLSPRGRCQPYAKDADGFVPGEGGGAVLLKPLTAAIRDEDPILGIVRGSAVNNDGGAMSKMAPNPSGQKDVIRAALADATVEPRNITYVEGHGAGTRIGDLVEVQALADVFAGIPSRSVGLGSVKSNVGHLFHAAGICGLIKVLLALRHEQLPPTVGCEKPNPKIQFECTPFFPVQSLEPWQRLPSRKRLAGISAFGVGGTNCHMIIEEPPERESVSPPRENHLLCLSALGPEELARVSGSLSGALEADNSLSLAEFCAIANQRACRYRHRRAMLVTSRREAIARLREKVSGIDTDRPPRLVFLFSGPGSHYKGMGRHLSEEPAFQKALAECDGVLRSTLGYSTANVLTDCVSELDRIDIAQPVSFVYGYAMARWLQSLEVSPDAVLGHSGGEYAAACVAGVLTLQDALRLSHARGQAMLQTEPGGMVVVYAPEAHVRPLLSGFPDIDVACINTQGQCVISGRNSSIDAVLNVMMTENMATEVLNISCAAHSPLMQSAQQVFQPSLESVKIDQPGIAVFSTVTGTQEKTFDKNYWLNHLRATVQFESAVHSALDAGYRCFVDLGPNSTLSQFVKEITAQSTQEIGQGELGVQVFPIVRRSFPGWEPTLTALGQLFERGASLSTAKLDGRFRSGKKELPTYPYNKETLWIEPPPIDYQNAASWDISNSQTAASVSGFLELDSYPSIRDHRVYGQSTAPSALFLDLILAEIHPGHKGQVIEDVLIEQPLALSPENKRLMRVRQKQIDGNVRVFVETCKRDRNDTWIRHVSASISPFRRNMDRQTNRVDLAAVLDRCPIEVTPEQLDERLALAQMEYGPTLRTIAQIWVGRREVVSRLKLPLQPDSAGHYHSLHPGLVDGAIRSVGALTVAFPRTAGPAFLGFAIKSVSVKSRIMDDCLAHIRLSPDCVLGPGCQVIRCDITLVDSNGGVLAELEEVCLKRVDAEDITHHRDAGAKEHSSERIYALTWEPDLKSDMTETTVPNRSTVLISAPTPLCNAVSTRVQAAEGHAVVVLPPATGSSWDRFIDRIIPDPSQSAKVRIVFMTPDVEELASFSVALAKRGVTTLSALLVVSPEATVMAFLRSLALEKPGWTCRGIQAGVGDVDGPTLYREACANSVDLITSYCDGRRHLPVLSQVAPCTSTPPLRQGGIYWITGGMGTLGQAISEELARRAGARILLTGRRPEADEKFLARIAAAGGEALYVSCDVADREEMERTHTLVRQRWGCLHGVIHAAGLVDDNLIVNRDNERSRNVIRTKTEGARVLAEITEDDNLDFLVFFSSLVAVTGMPGQTDYAASNAALDTLAGELHSRGRQVKTLNWGPWAVGMAADAHFQRIYKAKGLRPFSVSEGTAAFFRALSCEEFQLGIVGLDPSREPELLANLNAMPEPNVSTVSPALVGLNAMSKTTKRVVNPDGEEDSVRSKLVDQVRTVVAEHLHCSQEVIELSTSFKDQGIDSLMAVEIALEIQANMGIRLYPTLLLELQTVAELVDHLETLIRQGSSR